MDRLEQTQSVLDSSGLDQLRQAGQNNDKAALRKAAEHFESMFMNMLLKSMRKANEVLSDKDSPFNSQTSKFYRDMQDDQLAVDLSSSGALGLADIIVEQMSPEKGKYMPSEAMRNDGFKPMAPNTFDESLTVTDMQKSMLNPQSLSSNDEKKQHADPLSVLAIHAQDMEKHVLNLVDEKIEQQQTAKTELQPEKEFSSKQHFVNRLLPIAEKVSDAIGLPAVAMVAQAALETGWGQKMMTKEDGQSAFNFFGIKADSRWQGDNVQRSTQEFKFGQMTSEVARFRAYDDIESGLNDYVSFIKDQPRYRAAVDVAADPKAYFTQLQKAGYATDPNYADKILSVLKDKVFDQAQAQY